MKFSLNQFKLLLFICLLMVAQIIYVGQEKKVKSNYQFN